MEEKVIKAWNVIAAGQKTQFALTEGQFSRGGNVAFTG